MTGLAAFPPAWWGSCFRGEKGRWIEVGLYATASVPVPRRDASTMRDAFSGLLCCPNVSYEHLVLSMEKSPEW